MPDDFYEDDDTTNQADESEGIRGIRKAQKAAEARATAAEEALLAANAERREYAAMKAGLNPDDKMTAYFLAHYDGDPSADAMKTAAIEAGVLPDVDESAQQTATAQAQMAQAVGAGLTGNSGTTFVGPTSQRREVPAEQAEMWQEFEKVVSTQGAAAGAEVLQRYGFHSGTSAFEIVGYQAGIDALG